MQKENLKIVDVNIGELISSEYNPRIWSEIKLRELKESISKFGLVDPIIVNGASNRKNIVIGGHMRLKICKELKYKTMPVIYLNISNIEKEKELNIRLNKNIGDWDYDLLKEFDTDLLSNIGFSYDDLSTVFDDVLSLEDDDFDVTKHLEEIKETNIKDGDIFLLGKHKLICGDSLKIETYKKILEENKINLFFTDPPYNIKYDYDKGLGKNKKYGVNIDDNKGYEKYKEFLKTILSNSKEFMSENSHFFMFCDQNYTGLVQEIYRELKIKLQRTIVWIKNNQSPTPKIAFNKTTEFCVYGTTGKPFIDDKYRNLNEIMNKEVSSGNRLTDDILDLLDIWLIARIAGNEYMHPTQKPVTLYEKGIRRCSKINNIIFDACAGSGSLLIACEKLKRTFIGIEKEPIFCQVILNRFEELTKIKPIKLNK
jgi:DNA modification methylase